MEPEDFIDFILRFPPSSDGRANHTGILIMIIPYFLTIYGEIQFIYILNSNIMKSSGVNCDTAGLDAFVRQCSLAYDTNE